MKETGTTIFTLGLAMILVGSLSSGVILAAERPVRDVAILDCDLIAMNAVLLAFDTSDDTIVLPDPLPMVGSCAVNLAFLLSLGFEIEDIGTAVLATGSGVSRYTMVRTRRVHR